jgi:uncharacterized protein YjbJ (UPF0337 family)
MSCRRINPIAPGECDQEVLSRRVADQVAFKGSLCISIGEGFRNDTRADGKGSDAPSLQGTLPTRLAFFLDLADPPSPIGSMDMDWNRIEGNWKQMKGKIKQQWGKLTDDDLNIIAGRQAQLEGIIQERYGIERDAARKQVEEWYGRQHW